MGKELQPLKKGEKGRRFNLKVDPDVFRLVNKGIRKHKRGGLTAEVNYMLRFGYMIQAEIDELVEEDTKQVVKKKAEEVIKKQQEEETKVAGAPIIYT